MVWHMTEIGFRAIGRIPTDLLDVPGLLHDVVAVTNQHLKGVVALGQYYPAPPPNSKYRRVPRLKHSWKITPADIRGDRIVGSVYNTAHDKRGHYYASYVYGSTIYEQHPVHAGRWPTRTQLFDREAYLRDIRQTIELATGR